MATMAFEGRRAPPRTEKYEQTLFFTEEGPWAEGQEREPFRFIIVGSRTPKGNFTVDCIETDKVIPEVSMRDQAALHQLIARFLEAETGRRVNPIQRSVFMGPIE